MTNTMRVQRAGLVAAALALAATAPGGVSPSRMEGVPMSPEDRERRNAEKQARAPRLLARAEAKRQRRAKKRKLGVSASPDQRDDSDG